MTSILIDIHDRNWTLDALHHACRLVESSGGTLTLLQLIPSHPFWLGNNSAYLDLSRAQRNALEEYATVVEEYGLLVEVQLMHYITRREALLQASDILNVDIVLSKKITGIFPLWNTLQQSRLARELSKRQRQLLALAEADFQSKTLPSI